MGNGQKRERKSSENPVKIQWNTVKGKKNPLESSGRLEVCSEIIVLILPHCRVAFLEVHEDVFFALRMKIQVAYFLVFVQEIA